MDTKNQKIYYSGSDNELFDNLFVYDIKSGNFRQIDKDYILMITNDGMAGGGNRKIQMLTISGGKFTPFYVEGLLEPQSIYPGHDAEHLYVLGRDLHNQFSLYDYNIKTKKLNDLLAGYSFPEGHKTVVDFTYLYMNTQYGDYYHLHGLIFSL